jgi:hypothetical protein
LFVGPGGRRDDPRPKEVQAPQDDENPHRAEARLRISESFPQEEGSGQDKNSARPQSPEDGQMKLIEYDVSHVPLPFPLKDPEIDDMTAPREAVRPRIELPPGLERFRLFDTEELGSFPPVAWLIDKRLAAGELTVFYGKGDTFKSFVALDTSCHLAHAGHLVIYIAAEGASGMRARVAAWMKHYNVAELPSLLLMPSNVNLHQAKDVDDWIEAVQLQLGDRQPTLVVVDTLARNFVGGSENDAKDLGLFVEGLERIRRELRTAVLVLHHSTKDDKSERGTEALRNASFAVFHFERKNTTAVDVKCERMKDAEQPPVQRVAGVKVVLPELGQNVSSLVVPWGSIRVDPNQAPLPESAPETTRPERALLAALADPNQDPKRASLARRLRVSEETIKRHTKSLLEKGLLHAEGTTRDRRYALTAAGRKALS